MTGTVLSVFLVSFLILFYLFVYFLSSHPFSNFPCCIQLQNWSGGAPNMYDISGSAHFINKCDNGIVIHRNRDPDSGPIDLLQVVQ